MTRNEVKRVIGYLRASTEEQRVSGLGLAAQEQAIRAHAKSRGWTIVRIASDIASGKSMNGRHQLRETLADLKAHHADAIVVSRLDRLSRSVRDFSLLLDTAHRQRFHVIAIDLDLDTSTPTGEAMAHMTAVFAQLERRLIGQRTQAALAVKKSQGVRLGRARIIAPDVERRIKRLRKDGLSLRGIAAKLNAEARCVPPSGGTWCFTTIARVVNRGVVTSVSKSQGFHSASGAY